MSQMLLQPKEPGEFSASEYELDPELPTNPSKVIFYMHPSRAGDCDNNGCLNEPLNEFAKTNNKNGGRNILVLDASSYMSPESLNPTTVRTDKEHWKWFRQEDISGSELDLTFVGGNLTRCLGACVQNLNLLELSNVEKVTVNLPLNLIYTIYGTSASDQLLSRLSGEESKEEQYEKFKLMMRTGIYDTKSPLDLNSNFHVTILMDGEQVDSHIPIEVKADKTDWGDLPDGWSWGPAEEVEKPTYPPVIFNISTL